MASFLLGILTGMAIEEVCRYCHRRLDRFIKKVQDLPDVVVEDNSVGGLDKEKTILTL